MSCVLRDSTISIKEKRKERISLSEPPTVKGISRSKMSCLKGSTVDACRIFSSLLSVSTSAGRQHHVSVPKDAVVVQVSRAECWLWLSRRTRSSHHSKPIFDELQSPHSVALWNFLFWGGRLEFESCIHSCPPPSLPISACSHIWWMWIPRVWDAFWAECAIKSVNCVNLFVYVCMSARVLFFYYTCGFPPSLGEKQRLPNQFLQSKNGQIFNI